MGKSGSTLCWWHSDKWYHWPLETSGTFSSPEKMSTGAESPVFSSQVTETSPKHLPITSRIKILEMIQPPHAQYSEFTLLSYCPIHISWGREGTDLLCFLCPVHHFVWDKLWNMWHWECCVSIPWDWLDCAPVQPCINTGLFMLPFK